MLIHEILADLPDPPHEARRFNFMATKNRRFMFEPKSGKFLIGDAQGAGRGKRGVLSSHAEEYFAIRGTNKGFDTMIRGWMGVGGQYRHGVIHFAPPIHEQNIDAGLKTLAAFIKCGADGATVVRGFPGAWEQPLQAILPDLLTETISDPGLRAWFAGSKIVNDDNQPLVVHHFTYNDFVTFDRMWAARRFTRDPEGIDTLGSWFTDNPHARYVSPALGGKRMDVILSVKRPFYVDDIRDGDGWDQLRQAVTDAGGSTALRNKLKQQGYDGIILNGTRLDGVVQNAIIVFEPEQIRQVGIGAAAAPIAANQQI